MYTDQTPCKDGSLSFLMKALCHHIPLLNYMTTAVCFYKRTNQNYPQISLQNFANSGKSFTHKISGTFIPVSILVFASCTVGRYTVMPQPSSMVNM